MLGCFVEGDCLGKCGQINAVSCTGVNLPCLSSVLMGVSIALGTQGGQAEINDLQADGLVIFYSIRVTDWDWKRHREVV